MIYFILLRSVLYLVYKLMFAGLRLDALKARCLFLLLRVIISAEIQGCLFLSFCLATGTISLKVANKRYLNLSHSSLISDSGEKHVPHGTL